MRKWPWALGAGVGALALVAGLLIGDTTNEAWRLATAWTARAAFPIFIVTFVASALARLYPSAWTKALLRDRRYWGLGFASAFALHAVALLVYNWVEDNFPPTSLTDTGLLAYLVLLAMVLTSTDIARKRLGRLWKALHLVGMWGFWFIFGPSFYLEDILALRWPETNPLTDHYAVICALAVLLKLAAWAKSRMKRRR